LLKVYQWPDMDTACGPSSNLAVPRNNGSFSELSAASDSQTSQRGDDFQSMSEQLFIEKRPSPTAAAALLLTQQKEKTQAREEGRIESMAASAKTIEQQNIKIEQLRRQALEQEAHLNTHREKVEQITQHIMAEFLAILGEGRLRIDGQGWLMALEALRQALAPEPCKGFESQQEPPELLGEAAALLVCNPNLPLGEIRGTDGKRTIALTPKDLAHMLLRILSTEDHKGPQKMSITNEP
jgi:hypothetical protein